jgi:acetamidase/formamidase
LQYRGEFASARRGTAAAQAMISELDAYALRSVAVSFRVTQVVDIVRGVHALIPKSIFAPQLRREMTMV